MRELLLKGLEWDSFIFSDTEGVLATKFLGVTYSVIFEYDFSCLDSTECSFKTKEELLNVQLINPKSRIVDEIFVRLADSLKDGIESVCFANGLETLEKTTLRVEKSNETLVN